MYDLIKSDLENHQKIFDYLSTIISEENLTFLKRKFHSEAFYIYNGSPKLYELNYSVEINLNIQKILLNSLKSKNIENFQQSELRKLDANTIELLRINRSQTIKSFRRALRFFDNLEIKKNMIDYYKINFEADQTKNVMMTECLKQVYDEEMWVFCDQINTEIGGEEGEFLKIYKSFLTPKK